MQVPRTGRRAALGAASVRAAGPAADRSAVPQRAAQGARRASREGAPSAAVPVWTGAAEAAVWRGPEARGLAESAAWGRERVWRPEWPRRRRQHLPSRRCRGQRRHRLPCQAGSRRGCQCSSSVHSSAMGRQWLLVIGVVGWFGGSVHPVVPSGPPPRRASTRHVGVQNSSLNALASQSTSALPPNTPLLTAGPGSGDTGAGVAGGWGSTAGANAGGDVGGAGG